MSATFSIILDTRRIKQYNKYPIKLRVTCQRVVEYYQTVFDLSKGEWEKLPASRIGNELRIIRNKLKEIERNALACIDNMGVFSFEEFEGSFIQTHPYFRQRKQKNKLMPENDVQFDYIPFHKRFPILTEMPGKSGSISYSYLILHQKINLRRPHKYRS